MDYTPGGQNRYYNYAPPYYAIAHEEKRQIRSTSNQVCWTALLGILGMSLFAALGSLYARAAGVTYNAAYADFQGFHPVVFYLLIGVGYSLGLAVPALLYFAVKRMPPDLCLPFHKTGIAETAAFVFFGVLVCMLANYPADLVSAVEKSVGFSGKLPDYPLSDDWRVLALYGIDIVLIPPFVEEMMFRGVILQSLRRYGSRFAIVASALLFGLFHGNFIQMVFAFFCGLIMAYADIRTNSLLPSILMHFLNNGISFALEMVQRYQGESVQNYVGEIILLALVVLGLLSLILLIIKAHRSPLPADRSALPLSSRMGALFTNAGGVCFLAYGIVSSILDLVKG